MDPKLLGPSLGIEQPTNGLHFGTPTGFLEEANRYCAINSRINILHSSHDCALNSFVDGSYKPALKLHFMSLTVFYFSHTRHSFSVNTVKLYS